MKPELQKICEEFIADRDEVKKAFKMELDTVYPMCANIFLAHQKRADETRLRECREIIKDHASIINNFRGSMYAPCASFLACRPDPERSMGQASENYRLLKEYFMSSDSLVLAALLLTALGDPDSVREKAERGRELYKMMREKHRFLTGGEDSVFAVLMAFSDRSNEELIDESEKCYELLKGVGSRDALQTVAQILAMSEGTAEEKCARFEELFESIRNAGMKYGKNYELPVLAALSVKDIGIAELVDDIAEVSAFLKTQSGYKTIFGADQRTRLMHAAMLVSTANSPSIEDDAASLAAMLAIVAIQMIIIMVICTHTAVNV